MGGTYSTDDLLLALLIEARVQTQLLAEEFGRDDEIDDMRADEQAAIGTPSDPLAALET